MKSALIVLLGLSFLFISSVDASAEIVVYTNEDILSMSGSEAQAEETVAVLQDGGTNVAEIAGGGVNFILEGSQIADFKISMPVVISQQVTIVDVETTEGDIGFAIMRIENGKEIQVLRGDSEHTIVGRTLEAGTYKAYPDSNLPRGASIAEKITVRVYIAISGTHYPSEENIR